MKEFKGTINIDGRIAKIKGSLEYIDNPPPEPEPIPNRWSIKTAFLPTDSGGVQCWGFKEPSLAFRQSHKWYTATITDNEIKSIKFIGKRASNGVTRNFFMWYNDSYMWIDNNTASSGRLRVVRNDNYESIDLPRTNNKVTNWRHGPVSNSHTNKFFIQGYGPDASDNHYARIHTIATYVDNNWVLWNVPRELGSLHQIFLLNDNESKKDKFIFSPTSNQNSTYVCDLDGSNMYNWEDTIRNNKEKLHNTNVASHPFPVGLNFGYGHQRTDTIVLGALDSKINEIHISVSEVNSAAELIKPHYLHFQHGHYQDGIVVFSARDLYEKKPTSYIMGFDMNKVFKIAGPIEFDGSANQILRPCISPKYNDDSQYVAYQNKDNISIERLNLESL